MLQRVSSVLTALAVLALVLLAAIVAGVVPPPVAFLGPPQQYERVQVTITDDNQRVLGTVDARVADTYRKRYTGLSATDSLPSGTGMVFTYEEESEHTYVMREMDFPLDIVFIGTDGRITGIESARAPGPGEDGNAIQRTGTGQYVLEVPRGWTARRNISAGDHVDIPLNETTSGP